MALCLSISIDRAVFGNEKILCRPLTLKSLVQPWMTRAGPTYCPPIWGDAFLKPKTIVPFRQVFSCQSIQISPQAVLVIVNNVARFHVSLEE